MTRLDLCQSNISTSPQSPRNLRKQGISVRSSREPYNTVLNGIPPYPTGTYKTCTVSHCLSTETARYLRILCGGCLCLGRGRQISPSSVLALFHALALPVLAMLCTCLVLTTTYRYHGHVPQRSPKCDLSTCLLSSFPLHLCIPLFISVPSPFAQRWEFIIVSLHYFVRYQSEAVISLWSDCLCV